MKTSITPVIPEFSTAWRVLFTRLAVPAPVIPEFSTAWRVFFTRLAVLNVRDPLPTPKTPIILAKIACIFLLLFSTTSFATSETRSDAERYTTLTKEVRCVVCQNQNLADSTAPLADDLRQKIYTMILEKKSDAEIKDYLVKRYGEFILLRPRFSILTLFLWLFPLLGIGWIAWYFFRSTSTTINKVD